ncbi:unnamed protein product, partial [Symbiodinium pilosum]
MPTGGPTRTGQWTEDNNWQFELRFCACAQRQCRESKRGRARDFRTDKFRTVALGDLADKKNEWVARSPRNKYVEMARLSGDCRFDLGDAVLANLSAVEKELGERPTRRKGKTAPTWPK